MYRLQGNDPDIRNHLSRARGRHVEQHQQLYNINEAACLWIVWNQPFALLMLSMMRCVLPSKSRDLRAMGLKSSFDVWGTVLTID